MKDLYQITNEPKFQSYSTFLSDSEYHSSNCPGVSRSELNNIRRSSVYYEYRKTRPLKQTPEMLLGSAVHCIMLEPDKFQERYTKSPKFNLRTKIGREDYVKFCEININKQVLTIEQWRTVREIRDMLNDSSDYQNLMKNTVKEEAIFWRDEKTGIICKCKPDAYRLDHSLSIDLKTTINCSPVAFQRELVNRCYDMQAAYYLEGLTQLTKTQFESFVFVAIEKVEPYDFEIYLCDNDTIEIGKDLYRSGLELYSQHVNNSVVTKPRKKTIKNLSLPGWAYDLTKR